MRKILVDSGPLVALFDKSDDEHQRIVHFLKNFRGELLTTWPVVTEVTHLLDFSVQAQIDFYTWIERGGVEIENMSVSDLDRIRMLTAKYKDRPMDLADASLVIIAERREVGDILTLDSDFLIYRWKDRRSFCSLLVA